MWNQQAKTPASFSQTPVFLVFITFYFNQANGEKTKFSLGLFNKFRTVKTLDKRNKRLKMPEESLVILFAKQLKKSLLALRLLASLGEAER